MTATISILGLWTSDKTIFAGMQLPASVNKDILIPELLAQCAEFEILYPDAGFIRHIIESWSRASIFKWQKLADTMDLKYDPIENYNRTEEWTDNAEISPGSTETVSQNSYENAGMVAAAQTSRSGKDSSNATHKGHMFGNIGTTTSQQMLREEREVSDFNIYQIIIDDFKNRFCLQVY